MPQKDIVGNYFSLPLRLSKDTDLFIKQLGRKPPKNLDGLVQHLHSAVFEEVDCLSCANCCKSISPAVTDVDIDKLSKFLRKKPSQIVAEYFYLDSDGDYVFKSQPCPFILPDNYCLVYESRPKACRDYPHTDRRRFAQLLPISRLNVSVCPAVHEIFVRLKDISG